MGVMIITLMYPSNNNNNNNNDVIITIIIISSPHLTGNYQPVWQRPHNNSQQTFCPTKKEIIVELNSGPFKS